MIATSGVKQMLAVVREIGKYESNRAACSVLKALGFHKSKSGWMGKKTGARVIYLPATNRYQVQEVMPV